MNLLDPISRIMTSNLITLKPKDSIASASAIFKQHRIHHIPVVEGNALTGLVSKSDFLLFKDADKDPELEEKRLESYTISTIMTKGIARLESSDRINAAMELFKENIFHAIPIVDNNELVGIITTYDIINTILNDNEVHSSYDKF